MKNLLSIRQIIKGLKCAGWSWIPSAEAIHILFDRHDLVPKYMHFYYDARYSMDLILRNVMELKDIQDTIDRRNKTIEMNHQDVDDTRDSYEDEVSYYHPKGMSNASMELLKNDEVWYEQTSKKPYGKKVHINESKIYLLK